MNMPVHDTITCRYDSSGNIIRKDKDKLSDGTINFAIHYEYDSEGKLITENFDKDNNGTYDDRIMYTYDENRNLARKTPNWGIDRSTGDVETYQWTAAK